MVSIFNIRLFGFPQLSVRQRLVKLARRKTLALLAYLAVVAGTDHPALRSCGREELAAIFYPDCPREKANAYLRQTLWELSRVGGENLLIKDNQAVALNHGAEVWVDVNAFSELMRQWKTAPDRASAVQVLTQAIELYRSDFLAGFTLPKCLTFDNWQSLQAETLRLQLSKALEAIVDLNAQQGNLESSLAYARRWLGMDPLNESAHRTLMWLYQQNGQHLAALRQYEACRNILENELGIQPEPETGILYQEILENRGRQTAALTVETQQEHVPITASWSAHPTGTVTFLFTDIERSTYLWEHYPQSMRGAFAQQESIIRQAVSAHNGYIYKMIGDAFQAAFSTAPDALNAAVQAQRSLQHAAWGEIGNLRVRMALHTGKVEERQEDYVGPTLNRVARILSAGSGGQILLNQPTYELLLETLPEEISLRDLGVCYLKDLLRPEHIYQVLVHDLPDGFPALKTMDEFQTHLPVQNTPFIGREDELAHIHSLLENPECRLITLVGIGGTGKTRLAIQAARQSQVSTLNACFISLVDAVTLSDLTTTIAKAVGLSFYNPPGDRLSTDSAQEQIFKYLSTRKLLLILDNFEHLILYADFIESLLEEAVNVKIIVTSRLRLNLSGEWVIDVPGLSFPGKGNISNATQYAAIQLFLQTADRKSGFSPADEDWSAITRICQSLEGMPLGIEMAAAWTKIYSCQDIAAEIGRDMDFLSATWRGMPERHRTLRAIFERSCWLMDDTEMSIFTCLAVFQGGFNREAALKISGASLALLTSLMDKSFLRRISSGRFEIQPVLRPFITERLSKDTSAFAAIRAQHAAYYTDWSVHMSARLKGSEQVATLVSLRAEMLNLLAAWNYLVEQRAYEHLRRWLPMMILFDVMNDRLTEQDAIYALLDKMRIMLTEEQGQILDPTAQQSLLALVLAALRYFTFTDRNLVDAKAIAYHQESLRLLASLPDTHEKALIILVNCIGSGSITAQETLDLSISCIDLYERLGDPWGKALARLICADVAQFGCQNFDFARSTYHSSLEDFTASKNDWGRALCLTGLLYLEGQTLNLQEALRLSNESIEIYSRLNNQIRISFVNHTLGETAEACGDLVVARRCYESNLSYFSRIGNEEYCQIYRRRLETLGTKKLPGQ
jgi:DNA-binding SARP family transcriptional activator/predicted ATPase